MIKMSVFLSSDYKNTVSLEGTPAEIADNIATAKNLFQKIIGEYGPKTANGHITPPTTVRAILPQTSSTPNTNNGVSNGYTKNREFCMHTSGTKILISGSQKNPGKKFIACSDCGAFKNWAG